MAPSGVVYISSLQFKKSDRDEESGLKNCFESHTHTH